MSHEERIAARLAAVYNDTVALSELDNVSWRRKDLFDRGSLGRYSLLMNAAHDFETFVDSLSRAWSVPTWMAFTRSCADSILAMVMMRREACERAESVAYEPAPGARNFYLHDGYRTATLVHGSDLAVSLGGGR